MKKLMSLLLALGLIVTLAACGNHKDDKEDASSEVDSKIDKDMIQNMQGKWEADDEGPSTIEIKGKDVTLDSTARSGEYKIVEAKDGQWTSKDEDGDELTGSFTDSSLNATTQGGTDFTMTRPQ